MVEKGWKWLQMTVNGWKWLQMTVNGWEWLEMTGNGWKWSKMVRIGWKWLEMIREKLTAKGTRHEAQSRRLWAGGLEFIQDEKMCLKRHQMLNLSLLGTLQLIHEKKTAKRCLESQFLDANI